MTPSEIHDLIVTACTNLLILGTGLIGVYYKLRAQFSKKVDEVKHHTDVSVQKLNGMLTYVIHSFDRPAWIKVASRRLDGEIEFRMLEMNDLYAKTYGISRNNYLGKTDLEAGWDLKTAEEFRSHDLMVWASGQACTFGESVGGKDYRFRKIRLQSPGGEIKGILCYAVDWEDRDSENSPFYENQTKEESE